MLRETLPDVFFGFCDSLGAELEGGTEVVWVAVAEAAAEAIRRFTVSISRSMLLDWTLIYSSGVIGCCPGTGCESGSISMSKRCQHEESKMQRGRLTVLVRRKIGNQSDDIGSDSASVRTEKRPVCLGEA